jgi:hypothetical protein
MTSQYEIDTVTKKQIEALSEAAGAASDRAMLAICRIALGEPIEEVRADMDLAAREDAIVSKHQTREAAREECVRVIAEAEREAQCHEHGCSREECDEAH